MRFDLHVLLGTAFAVAWGFASVATAAPFHLGGQDGGTHYDHTTGKLRFGTGADAAIMNAGTMRIDDWSPAVPIMNL